MPLRSDRRHLGAISRRSRLLLAALGLVTALAGGAKGERAAALGTSTVFGAAEAHQALPQARAAGLGWTRMNFFWNEFQPTSGLDWDSPRTISDADIAATRAAGLEIVGVIGNPPSWATSNGSVPLGLRSPVDAPTFYWAQFVRRLAATYRNRVDHWIIWNEPDIPIGQAGNTWAGSEAEYFYLLRSAFLAIKSVNPAARVGFAGTTQWADRNRGLPLFFQRVLDYGRSTDPQVAAFGYYFDFVPVHTYVDVYQLRSVPQAYRDVMRSFGLERPIWVTEMNVVPYDDPAVPLPRNQFRATQAEQANFMIQGPALALSAGVHRVGVYKLRDSIQGNLGEPYGLVRADGTIRPAFTAYETAVYHLNDMGRGTYTRTASHDQVVFQAGKRRVTVVWNPTPAAVTASIPVRGTSGYVVDKRGQRVRTMPSPAGRGAAISLTLPGATATDGRAYTIGGDPFLLVEEGVGDAVRLADGRLYFPITGHAIGGAFLAFFERYGGASTFGWPRSDETSEEGTVVQYFQNARMEFRQGAPGAIPVQLTLLNNLLRNSEGDPPVADPGAASGMQYFPETGHTLSGPFRLFFEERGALDVFGYPVSEPIIQPDGRVLQHFQRMRVLFDPAGPYPTLTFEPLGDHWLRIRGVALDPPALTISTPRG